MKWVPYVSIPVVILLVYLANSSHVAKDEETDRSIVKVPRTSGNTVMKPKDTFNEKNKSEVASPNLGGPREPTAVSGGDDSLDPLSNPFLAEQKKRTQERNLVFSAIGSEKRENIDLQIIGNGTWSLFSDLQVSKDQPHNELFKMGPFHVYRKDESSAGKSMGLIYEENQKLLGVLTGRVVLKVRDLFDVDPIVREYGLKIDSVSAEIRTAYLDASHLGGFSKLNATLKVDQRVERFYFEVVNTDWIKN